MRFELFRLKLTTLTIKICLYPGLAWADKDWWSSSSWTFLEQPQHFKPTPARYIRTERKIWFSRGIQDILTERVYDNTSCQEKHLSFHFSKGKTRTIKIPPSFGCFASLKMHKMHVRCKDANFLCNFFGNFLSRKWLNAFSENPAAVNSRSQNEKDNLLKLPPNQAASGLPISFYTGDFSS